MSEQDTSPSHFRWLTDCRSKNQQSTVNLYEVIYNNKTKLNRYPELQSHAQQLVSVAFSLWRAVFLSDVSAETERHMADVEKFLVSLIADNIVLYQTDKNSRNWSFRYYLENAEARLRDLSDLSPDLSTLLIEAAPSEKDRWRNAQSALDQAIIAFDHAVEAKPPVASA